MRGHLIVTGFYDNKVFFGASKINCSDTKRGLDEEERVLTTSTLPRVIHRKTSQTDKPSRQARYGKH
jgi:hypothetical protein